jgi:hypothetical protein
MFKCLKTSLILCTTSIIVTNINPQLIHLNQPISLGIPASLANPINKNPINQKEIGLGDFRLGDSYKVLDILGEPEQIRKQPHSGNYDSYQRLVYPDLTVDIGDQYIVWLTTNSPAFPTPQGIQVGDSLQKVFEIYGQARITDNDHDTVGVHYSFGSDSFLYIRFQGDRIIEITAGFLPD